MYSIHASSSSRSDASLTNRQTFGGFTFGNLQTGGTTNSSSSMYIVGGIAIASIFVIAMVMGGSRKGRR